MTLNKTIIAPPKTSMMLNNSTLNGVNPNDDLSHNATMSEEPDSESEIREPAATCLKRDIRLQQRVVVGLLYSVSKSLLGEIFPIYLGRNVIGTDSKCDIQLKETTVSAEHAVIYAKGEYFPEKLPITILDYGSSNGTMVDGQKCSSEALSVRDGNIISVGLHYKFLVRLFDIFKNDLNEDPDFAEVIQPEENTKPLCLNSDLYSPSNKKPSIGSGEIFDSNDYKTQ